MTDVERIEALKPKLTPEFLAVLTEAVEVVGWSVDFWESASFVEEVYGYAGIECPDLSPTE